MSIEDARRLVSAHRDEIATAIRVQTSLLAPAFTKIDDEARKATILHVIDALEKVLDGKAKSSLMRLVLDMAQLRKMTGMHESEMVVGILCYLPIIRRVFRAREPDLEKATNAFDALESWALPLIAEVIRSLMPDDDALSEADTISDGRNRLNITPVPFDI